MVDFTLPRIGEFPALPEVEAGAWVKVSAEARQAVASAFDADETVSIAAMHIWDAEENFDSSVTASVFLSTRDDEGEVYVSFRIGEVPADAADDPAPADSADVVWTSLDELLDQLPRLGSNAEFRCQSELRVPSRLYSPPIDLPLRIWAGSVQGLDELVGVRFRLRERGTHNGYVSYDLAADDLRTMVQFARKLPLDSRALTRTWSTLARLYKRAIIPVDTTGSRQ